METNNEHLPPSVLVVFGITGNLSQFKLLPAIYHLLKANRLPEKFSVVGVFRDNALSLENIIQQVEINILGTHQECDQDILLKLKSIIKPIIMDSTQAESYHRLRELLEQIDHENHVGHQRLFYLAIPPSIFSTVIHCLGEAGLNSEHESPARRIFVEKPFGINLENAKQLVSDTSRFFSENQIYRIDHYLAKETAQNILAFRFNNPIIEDLWGRQFIDHIQISAIQEIDIEGRAGFYEGMGALRDIVQSHLLQLMTLIMMEAPEKMESASIHEEKLALLESVQPIRQNHVDELSVRGQYHGYREEVKNEHSNTETYAALKLEVSNSRWGGVPVLLRTGKAMAQTSTEINVVFKARSKRKVPPNILTIRIAPNEGISIRLTAKNPGFSNDLQPVNMNFDYNSTFENDSPDAYERVLVDAIAGDQSLFATSAEIIQSWKILEPIIGAWQYQPMQPTLYDKGSWGPHDADDLVKLYGNDWINNKTS
jgi:glucose-6-phosphate 1-dehydrogenase